MKNAQIFSNSFTKKSYITQNYNKGVIYIIYYIILLFIVQNDLF